MRRATAAHPIEQAAELGQHVAAELKP